MTKILNIAVDAMGGEGSPKKTIDGIIHHSKSTKNINYNIFGNEEEIKKLRQEGKDMQYALTPEAKLLSSEFVSNKGNLPWPLSTGIIVSYFGKQKHEVFSGVETFNNGIDIATDKEAIIRAVFDGVISRIFFIQFWIK